MAGDDGNTVYYLNGVKIATSRDSSSGYDKLNEQYIYLYGYSYTVSNGESVTIKMVGTYNAP